MRFFTNLETSTNLNDKGAQWKFDLTYNWIGKQRIPFHELSIEKNGYSPSYSLLHAQITKVFSEKFEIYLGGENIGSYKQDKPILGDPFGTDFDTSIVYAPIHGSLFYLGLRFNI